MEKNNPTVTCIMPCHRMGDLPRAVELFNRQTYANKHLLIGVAPTDKPNIPLNSSVDLYATSETTIGGRRNVLCDAATGDIIIHLDSDDWYAPDWVEHCVLFMQETGADLIGLCSGYFYQPHTQAWQYNYVSKMPYVMGATMAYKKRIWDKVKFKPVSQGEDALFCAAIGGPYIPPELADTLAAGPIGGIVPHAYTEGFVAMITGQNTASHKQLAQMYRVSPLFVKEKLGKDASMW